MLQNNLNFLLNNINSASPKDDGTRYTIKLGLCDEVSEDKFWNLKKSIEFLKINHFEYSEPEHVKYWDIHSRKDIYKTCYYKIEIGIFKSFDEALDIKSKLPKGITYDIEKLNQ